MGGRTYRLLIAPDMKLRPLAMALYFFWRISAGIARSIPRFLFSISFQVNEI